MASSSSKASVSSKGWSSAAARGCLEDVEGGEGGNGDFMRHGPEPPVRLSWCKVYLPLTLKPSFFNPAPQGVTKAPPCVEKAAQCVSRVRRVSGPGRQNLPRLDAYGVCTDNFPIIDTNSFIHERIHPRRTY